MAQKGQSWGGGWRAEQGHGNARQAGNWGAPSQAQGQSWGQSQAGWGQQEQAPEPDDEKTFYAFYTALGGDGNPATGTLVGTYSEEGMNHGRKYYRKVLQGLSPDEHEVYMYYWDERDGAELNGWWFGNMVGGRQVWARNAESTPLPPVTGWNIPWDGAVQPEFQVTGLSGKRAHDQKVAVEMEKKRRADAAAERRRQQIWQWQQRLNSCTSHVTSVEATVSEVLTQAQQAQDSGSVPALDSVLAPLKQQMTATVAAQRILVGEAKVIVQNAPELKDEMNDLTARIKTLQAKIKEWSDSLSGIRAAKVKEIEEARQREEEERRNKELEPVQTQRFTEMFENTNVSATFAEDEVEKVTIAAAPLEVDAAEDMESMMLEALNETEARVTAAHKALAELKMQTSTAQKEWSQFIPSLKKEAQEKFAEIDAKHKELTEKLATFKNVRKDYQQRAKDKGILDELSEKVVAVEVQIDQAEAAQLETQADVKEVEKAITTAQSQLHLAYQRIEKKFTEISKQSHSALKDQATELYERAKEMKERVEKTMQQMKATRLKMVADILLAEVGKKVRAVEEGLTTLAEFVTPTTEDNPQVDEMKEMYAKAEKVAAQIKTSVAEAQAFMAMKLAETKRLSQDAGSHITEEIDAMKGRLDAGKNQLEEFKKTLSENMRKSLLKEVETGTDEAELEEQRLKECVSFLSISIPGEPASSELLAAVSGAVEAEQSAKTSLVTAHQALVAKTAELKKLAGSAVSSGTELGKLQNRQSAVFRGVIKHQDAIKKMEERLRVKDLLADFVDKCVLGEAEVGKAQEAAVPLTTEEEPSAEACKHLDLVSKSADTKLKTTMKFVDLKLRSAKGIFKEELQAIHGRLQKAEKALVNLTNSVKEQAERGQVTELVQLVNEKVETTEGLGARAQQAHAPFSEGMTGDMTEALVALEASLVEGEAACKETQESIKKSLATGKTLSELSKERITQELGMLQTRLDQVTASLAELRSSLVEYKKTNRSQAITYTVGLVEAAIAKLKGLVAQVETDDQLIALTEEALSALRDKLGTADQQAQNHLTKAKEFVTTQLKEVRSLPMQERQESTKALTAMQSKLTQLQIQLSTISSKCAESEQRFEAQAILKETANIVDRLAKDTEAATKIGAPFLDKKNNSKTVGMVLLQDVIFALEAYMKTSGIDLVALCAKLTADARGTLPEFAKFMKSLIEMTGRKDLEFTDKQINDMFSNIASEAEDGSFDMEDFKHLFLPRYICIEPTSMWEAQDSTAPLGVVEVDEIIRFTGSPPEGADSMQGFLGRDGSKVWVSLANEHGNPCFQISESAAWQIESVDAYVTAIHARCKQAAEKTDKHVAAVKSVKDGPLAPLKGKMTQNRMRMTAEQAKAVQVKKQVNELKASILAGREKELKTVKEAIMKDAVTNTVSEAVKKLEAAEGKITALTESTKSKDLQNESTVELASLKRKGQDAGNESVEAKELIAKALKLHSELPPALNTALRELRIECAKLNSRATTAERRCKTALQPVEAAYEGLVRAELVKSRAQLRSALEKSGQTVTNLLHEVSENGGGVRLSFEQFESVVSKLPDAGLSSEQVSVLFQDAGADGIDRLGLLGCFEEYMECKRSVVMTQTFELNNEIVRKIEDGELLQVVEGPTADPESGMKRANCRALRDNSTGWVSLDSNKGASLFKPAAKPIMVSTLEASVVEAFDSASAELYRVMPNESFELVEGPREAVLASETHLNGITVKDRKKGWILLSDTAGATYASQSSTFYKCKAPTALTDNADIQKCKPIRKIEANEILEVVESEENAPAEGESVASRIQVRAIKDGKQGWATIMGSRGTVFLEEDAQYKIEKSVALRAGMTPESAVVRQLEEGEIFTPVGEPQEQKPPGLVGVRVRSEDGQRSGWVVYMSGDTPPIEMRS